jgi:hypothetical protein
MVFVGQMDPIEVDKGARGKDFPQLLFFFYFGAIAVIIPANQKIVSGDDGGFGQLTVTERKTGKQFSGVATG